MGKKTFYAELDSNGNIGTEGQVRSLDVGYLNLANMKNDARRAGYSSFRRYLAYWWKEISAEPLPFTWQTLGEGYGHQGTNIYHTDDIIIKEIYGQVMVDQHAPRSVKYYKRNQKQVA